MIQVIDFRDKITEDDSGEETVETLDAECVAWLQKEVGSSRRAVVYHDILNDSFGQIEPEFGEDSAVNGYQIDTVRGSINITIPGGVVTRTERAMITDIPEEETEEGEGE